LSGVNLLARSLRVALVASALLAAPLPALAQAGDKAAAESLFQAGRELMNQKRYADACPKFAESQKLDPSAGTSLNLGQCYEALGKTASAWAEYKAGAGIAHTQGRTEQEAKANEFAAKLEPRLSKLRIDLGPDAGGIAGLVVKRDGVEVGRGSLGIGIAVDPGDHTITASAPGYKEWSATTRLGTEHDARSVVVTGLTKEAVAVVPPAGAGAPPAVGAGQPPPPAAPPASGSSTMRTTGWILGGAGVVGLGVGAVLGGLAMSQAGNAKNDPTLCPNKVCTTAGRAEIDGANGKALGSTIGFIAGGALLATGVVLLVVSGPSAKKEAAQASLVPSAGPGGGGLTLVERF
jgi:hypothetical protein